MSQVSGSQSSYSHSVVLRNALDPLVKIVDEIDVTYSYQLQHIAEQKKEFEIKYELKAQELRKESRQIEEKQKFNSEELEKSRQLLESERKDFEDEKQRFKELQNIVDEIAEQKNPITLEVGGDKFRTQISTLVKETQSIFPRLVKALQTSTPDKANRTIFIDRDSKHFKFILNYIRQGPSVMKGTVVNSKNADEYFLYEILEEIRYYNLPELEKLIQWKIISQKPSTNLQKLIDQGYLVKQVLPKMQLSFKPFKYASSKKEWQQQNLSQVLFENVIFFDVLFDCCVLKDSIFRECAFKGTIRVKNTDLTGMKEENCQGSLRQL